MRRVNARLYDLRQWSDLVSGFVNIQNFKSLLKTFYDRKQKENVPNINI